jgi:hypothetical protein
MSDERLEIVQARQEAHSVAGRRRAGTSAQSRRDRVARSRARAQGLKEGTPAEPEASEEETTEEVSDEVELPEGAVVAPEDGSVPEGYEIKGNANSMKYHVPGGRYYDITIGDVFFDTVEHAEAAGYEAPAPDEAVIEETIEAEQAADTEEDN